LLHWKWFEDKRNVPRLLNAKTPHEPYETGTVNIQYLCGLRTIAVALPQGILDQAALEVINRR
jgi:hypothetical protein